MPGGYLRTNWRSTSTIAGITGLGAGIPLASINGGVGGQPPYGGLIWLTSLNGNTFSASIHKQSAYGLMSAFYGGGMYDSGYKIQPLLVIPLSFSTLGGEAAVAVTSLRTSDSLIVFQAWTQASASATVVAVASGSTCNFQFLGLVVSGP